uniref:Uncharacterized protein n=1 Tax=Timspurckia oligopyrenoides TaxID=708627 RepID=A0A7S1ESF6_9RHOD|mmetsp:Transcript_404/g.748  ORF Transcript_404/g.748 Transcript_404/m.748 type:complete len:190 (+) Transcript_404:32-601(+)
MLSREYKGIMADAKKLKVAFKEGGKRGVELEGSADLSGIQYFNVAIDSAEGDVELLKEVMRGMNLEVDEDAEERKGGSGKIGKLILSAADHQLGLMCYIPEAKKDELEPTAWMNAVLESFEGGSIVSSDESTACAVIPANPDKSLFPLKMRDEAIAVSIKFLQGKELFPMLADDDDDDEYVYGDDDFDV